MDIAKQVCKKLEQLGYLHPAYGYKVSLKDLMVQDAVKQYQDFYLIDLHNHAQSIYGRKMKADGKVAMVTANHLLTARTCGAPDIQRASDGQVIAEANIPKTCRVDYKIYFDQGRWTSSLNLSKVRAKEIFAEALNEWNRNVGVRLSLTNTMGPAHTVAKWEKLSGSTLAWSHLANDSCAMNQEQRYDIRNWSEHMFYLVVLHEVGHLIGLPHRSGNYVMNPSIITSLETLTKNDITRARDLGYNGPLDPPPEDPYGPDTNYVKVFCKKKNGTTVSVSNVVSVSFASTPTDIKFDL